MGQQQSSPTDYDRRNELMQTFHQDPTPENYQFIRQGDEPFRDALGEHIYRAYILGMRTHLPVGEPLDEEESTFFNKEVERLLSSQTTLSSRDLDEMWALFYATGDTRFPDRVRRATTEEFHYLGVKEAAKWSYESHVRQGRI